MLLTPRRFFSIFHFLRTNITFQMWPSWGKGARWWILHDTWSLTTARHCSSLCGVCAVRVLLFIVRAVPDSVSRFVQIRLWPKFGRISAGYANVTLTGKTRFVYLSFHAITSRCLRDLVWQCVHGSTRSASKAKSTAYIIEIHILWPQDTKFNKILLIQRLLLLQ